MKTIETFFVTGPNDYMRTDSCHGDPLDIETNTPALYLKLA